MNYIMVRTVEVDKNHMPKESGAINGGIAKRNEHFKAPIVVVSVEDIDKSLEKIKKNCGKMLGEKMNVGDMGIYAYFKDTEGNVIGVWQDLKKH
ncbi:MAG TPA: VOC family protein [Candidatus Nanoarchaeia archaeon]|nr:VOC family protein [Candidatus Nanoarchaeia archaeon]